MYMACSNYLSLPLALCILQSLSGNERLHSSPQGPVHQQLHARPLPAPSAPLQLCRPVGPACHAAPQPLPSDPPTGAAADSGRRPDSSGDAHAHRRWVSGRTLKMMYLHQHVWVKCVPSMGLVVTVFCSRGRCPSAAAEHKEHEFSFSDCKTH